MGQHRDRPAESWDSRGRVGVVAGGWEVRMGGWEVRMGGWGVGVGGWWWVGGRGDGGIMIMSNTALSSRYFSP